MGSFFYGNPFGKNTGIFAYIASKQNSNISFEDSTFQREKSEKTTAARIVLGNIIKETGCFYTYETSFYGGWKGVRYFVIQGKKVHFDQEDYKYLARSLFIGLYKASFEIYKE